MRITIRNDNITLAHPGFRRIKPDRILGSEDQLHELGMLPSAKPSKESIMWHYENVPILVPFNREYEVSFELMENEEYGDLGFHNGVVFGYVEAKLHDWNIVPD